MKMNTTAGELVATSCGCCMLSRCVILISMGISTSISILSLWSAFLLVSHVSL